MKILRWVENVLYLVLVVLDENLGGGISIFGNLYKIEFFSFVVVSCELGSFDSFRCTWKFISVVLDFSKIGRLGISVGQTNFFPVLSIAVQTLTRTITKLCIDFMTNWFIKSCSFVTLSSILLISALYILDMIVIFTWFAQLHINHTWACSGAGKRTAEHGDSVPCEGVAGFAQQGHISGDNAHDQCKWHNSGHKWDGIFTNWGAMCMGLPSSGTCSLLIDD